MIVLSRPPWDIDEGGRGGGGDRGDMYGVAPPTDITRLAGMLPKYQLTKERSCLVYRCEQETSVKLHSVGR